MVSDKMFKECAAYVCFTLLVLSASLLIGANGISKSIDRASDNIVVPTAGDFDGEGLNNDFAIGYGGRMILMNGNKTRSDKHGTWRAQLGSVGYLNNTQLQSLAGLS